MALSHSPSIVTNGLVLNLDAANRRSYPGTGTVWTDVSGRNNHGTLTNGPTYSSANGGSIVFDGSNDHVDIGTNITRSIYDSSYTAECFCYPTNLGGDQSLFGNDTASVGPFRAVLHLILRNGTIHIGHYSSDFGAGTATLNAWNHIVFRFQVSNGEASTFKNGVLQGTGTIQSYIGDDAIRIGKWGGFTYFNGSIAIARIYNRALSASEIAQNYNATRGRFGV